VEAFFAMIFCHDICLCGGKFGGFCGKLGEYCCGLGNIVANLGEIAANLAKIAAKGQTRRSAPTARTLYGKFI